MNINFTNNKQNFFRTGGIGILVLFFLLVSGLVSAQTAIENSFTVKYEFGTGTSPRYVALGDLDGDGFEDIVVANNSDNTISVFRNISSPSGKINYAAQQTFATGLNPTNVEIGDLDGDGKQDLVVTNSGGNSISVLRNTSAGTGAISFAAKVDFAPQTSPNHVAIGDLDGDGKMDLAVTNSGSQTISIFRNTGSAGVISFAAQVAFATGVNTLPLDLAMADMDGDSKLEVIVINFVGGTASILRNVSTGSGDINFAAKVDIGVGGNPRGLVIFDMDDDGKKDLATIDGLDKTLNIRKNTSSGIGTISLGPTIQYSIGGSPFGIAKGDLNGDGKEDIAVANELVASVFLNLSTSAEIAFNSKLEFDAATTPTYVAIGHADDDLKSDLFLSSPDNNLISILRNSDSPLAFYPFNGDANDVSGNGNNGVVNAGVTFTSDRHGNAGASASFDGTTNAFIDLGATSIDFTSGLTFSVWSKSSATNAWERYVDMGETGGLNNVFFGRSFMLSTLVYQVFNGTEQVVNFEVADAIVENQWQQYVVTHDVDQSIKIYVDGVLIGTGTGPLPVTATRTESYLGKSLFNGDGFLQGELDEVRIYNKAITEAEVSALYQSSNSGLVAHYPFNGDSNDLSGNGLDGIINGASPATDRFGMPNGAYYFDGSSSIEVVNAAAFDFDDFTYSVWVSPDLISTGFATVVSTSNDQAWLGQNNGFWEPYGVCPASNQPAVTLGWHHLVWVKSGTNATVYLDNVPVVTSTSCGIGFMEVAGIMIGNNALGESFRGSIDDLKIYNRALSASEISNLFSESAFVTTWEVTNPDLTITISTEVGLTYDFDIDWGDGTVLTNLTGDVSHTYASAGIKTISINGVFPHFKSYSKDKIRSVEQWGNIVWSSMNFTFGDVASGLAINATDAPDLSQVTDMSLMFKNLNFTGDNLKNWDVSNVQNMWSMFFSANFNEDLSSWNVANVTNMSSMFIYTGDSYFGDISNWNVSSCIDMNGMFQNNVDFNTDISGWNVSNVTNMASMFGGASLFNADISGWNVSNISEMGQMFQEAESFNQPIGNWNVSKVVNMPYLFLGALSFNQNLSGWDISQVGNFDGIFNGTNMSLGNYDNTLDGWATLDAGETQIPTNVIFGAYGVPYCSSNGGRNTLINDYGWEITGDVFSCPNVVAEYSFDGDATDLSGNGYNGIINGASSAVDRFANNDAAYSFNGVDQDITISDVEVIFSEITVSVWLNFGTGQGDGAHTLIDLSGLAGIALEDNEILGVLNIQNDYSITNKLPLNPNEWHHVTMTYDQSDLVLFVDGEIASVRNLPGLITQEATLYDMTIGRIGLDLNRYYGGILDDIRIFNRALSSSEVAGLYTEKGYVSQRDILMTFYNSTDGANWFNNTGWGTAADLSTWHGLTLENGNVASLDLRSNNLNGTVPASIAELQSLNELFFFNNLNLGGAIPAELGNLTNLTRLSFQACSMTGDIPAELGNLTSLTFLVLGPNQLTGSVPDSFANFANITIFAIHQNQLTSLPDLSGMPATIFWVQENKFTFDELLVNLPQANTANANFGPQTADDSYEYIAVNGETIELSTNETALGTTYQWYFNDAIIEGADLVNHIFDFTNADEGTYYCVMANDNVPGVTITRANIILDNGINTIPTGIELSNNILNDGELAGFYVGSFTTIDEDPADMHTYSLVAGIGDTFNGEFIIEEDQLIISTDVDYVVNPVYQIRVATTDSSGEIFEQTFEVLVKPFMVCNNNYFTDASGTFSDGSGVFNYDDNFSCSWQIEVPEGYVRLDFSAFDTELDYDFVRIYDGYDASAPLLAEFSGTTIPATFVSPSNALYITFITDQLVNSAGWTASYSAVTPVAFYPFNGNAFDESGNGNDGTVNEAVLVADRFGNADEAYNFDGANDAISGDASSFPSGAAPRTISGWINVLEQTGYLMTYGSTAVEGGMFGLGIQGGLPIFWGHFADVYGSQVINYNEWVFLAFTYDGANLSIYVNGELDTTAPLILDTQPASYFDIASNWSGSMDDITIYDVALSPKAIEQLYSENGWPNVPANLIPNLSSAGGKHWKLAPRDHAFYVGPSIGSSEWYANTQVDVTERDCLFDDQFIFYDDGTFLIDLNGLIWAEDYLANFGCVTIDQLPLAFQVMGQGAYTYSTAASSANSAITVNGAGAFLGFSKGYNGGEYPTDGTGNPVSSITYTILNYEVIENKEYMTITIDISPDLDGTSWWTYELVHDPLVASYAFNGNANDQTSNNLDGTVNGAVSANDRTGSANAAYSFDGVSSFIQTPATLEDFAPFSISTWVKWDGNNSDFTEIVSWWNNSAISKTYLGTSPTTNEIRFGDSWPNTGAFLPTNQWVNLVATFDGAVARIYTDGNLAATSTAGLTYGFDGDLYIGTQGTQGGEFFGGLIDDIEIYTRQLSDEEILSSYEANKTDLLAYYPFRGDLIDAIGNGFDGLELTSGNSFVPDRIGTNGSGSADAYNIDYFSGGAFEISNSANYDFGDEITVMTWVRPDLYETNDIQIIDNVLDGFGFHLYLIVGDVPVEEQSFKRKLYAAIPGVSWGEAGEVLTDRWTHIAFKYTRGCCIRLYINGQEVAAYGLAAGGEDAPIAISSSALLVGTGHHGFLDELKIFKTALTNEEIYAEYANNLWPFANTTILGPDGAVDYPMDIVTSDAFGNETNVHAKVIDIPLGNYQIHGDGNGLNTYFGDNELDGFVEPFGTQVALNAGIHAFRFDHSNLSYYMEPITSIGLIGSARTGDDTGGTAEDELVDLGNGIYQIKNIKLYDGEWKLRMNNQWNILDWGWHGTEGQLAYIGQNIPISAGTYTISVDLINNRYSVIETTPGLWETVAELEFNGDLLDTSGFDNHGTSASTTHTTDRFGVANGAISLGAFDFVSIGTDPEIQLNNGFTMNIWINPVDNNNSGGLFTSTGSFHQHLYDNFIDWRYFQNGQEFPINAIPVIAPNNSWTMFTWVYDGAEMRFYDDGVLVHTAVVFGDLDLPGNSYDIGNGFDGAVDEFIWVDGVLNDFEILSLYNDGFVASYALDGNTIDAINGYDGVANGGLIYGLNRFGDNPAAGVFDGIDDYIDLGTAPVQHINNEITLAAWIKGGNQVDGGILGWWLGFRLEVRSDQQTVNFGTYGLSND
ncbi:MAG: surface protein, partial [Cyclobacteriaceae bacterium]